MNLTVSFISSLSSPVYLLLSFSLSALATLPRPASSTLSLALALSPSLSFSLSEFCAELPAIIIIALLPIISTTPLRNCTSMLLIHFLFGQRGLTVDEKSQIPLRNFRSIESFPLLLLPSHSLAVRLYILQQQTGWRKNETHVCISDRLTLLPLLLLLPTADFFSAKAITLR